MVDCKLWLATPCLSAVRKAKVASNTMDLGMWSFLAFEGTRLNERRLMSGPACGGSVLLGKYPSCCLANEKCLVSVPAISVPLVKLSINE